MALKILLLHYYFPPLRSAGVYRNYFFAQEFAKRFSKVCLITSSNRHRLESEALPIPSNIFQRDAWTFDYRTVLSMRPKKGNHLSERSKSGRLFQSLIKLKKTLPFNFLIGEGGPFYIWNAFLLASREIEDRQLDFVFSSYAPYADHLVAFLLKKKYPGLRWVADFRDLQVEPVYQDVFWIPVQKKIERYLLRKADLVITVSKGLASHLHKYDRPVLAIPKGIKLRDEPDYQSEKFTICYTGSLFKNFRHGAYFFKVLSELVELGSIVTSNLSFKYAGKDGGRFGRWAADHGLAEIFTDCGYVSRAEVLKIQEEANIQLLLTSSSSTWTGVFTGKLFEYVESGNPILALISGPKDQEFDSFLGDIDGGITAYDPPILQGRIEQFILRKYQHWLRTGKSERTLNRDLVEREHSWRTRVDSLFSALN